MPNRILKERICRSDEIDQLSWMEEVLYYRLIVNCDDFGRFDGRIPIIKNTLFPLKENMTAKSVKCAIDKLVTVGLVVLYEFEGKPYLQLPTWDKHQTIRAKKSKYPPYESDLKSSEIICKQLQANVPVIQSESESYSESESITPPTPSKGGEVCAKRFAEFWDAYPRKEGKERARQAFKKLGPDEDLLRRMLDAIELQKASDQWTREDGKYIPHPATWLNGKRWEDEVKPASSGNMFADYLAEMRGGGGTIFV